MRYCLLLLSLAVIAGSSSVRADDKYEIKRIAVVDVKRITDESLAAKTAQKEVGKLKDKYLAEIKAEDKKLQDRQKQLVGEKKVLSAEAFNKKVLEFRKLVDVKKAEAAKKQKVVEAAYLKSLELIRDETMKVIAEIAKDKELDLVIPSSQLLFSKPATDITQETLGMLNERLTKVDINVK